MQGDRLLKILVQQYGQVVLRDAEQLLLTADASRQRLDPTIEFVDAPGVQDDLGNLTCEQLNGFDGGSIRSQPVGRIIQADDTQGFTGCILNRQQEEVIWIPGVLPDLRFGVLGSIDIMNVRRQYRRLIGRDVIRTTDAELGLGQLLKTGKLLLPRAKLGEGFRLDARTGHATQESCVRFRSEE